MLLFAKLRSRIIKRTIVVTTEHKILYCNSANYQSYQIVERRMRSDLAEVEWKESEERSRTRRRTRKIAKVVIGNDGRLTLLYLLDC
jgi:dephospho-CoA kinase